MKSNNAIDVMLTIACTDEAGYRCIKIEDGMLIRDGLTDSRAVYRIVLVEEGKQDEVSIQ